MDPIWLLLLLPLAAVGGWFMAKRDTTVAHTAPMSISREKGLSDAYFKGLRFLLNEQPDKALQVFLEVVEVDQETLEVHLALGNLFRRQGEIERATRIHQNLISRPGIDEKFRAMALFELAQDYLKAGLLDRAENLFKELVQFQEFEEHAYQFLMQIYDQEKEWKSAIIMAEALSKYDKTDLSNNIAHYYCELAESAITQGNYQQADDYLNMAFKHSAECVRAVIQSGRLVAMKGHHTNAIDIWRGLEHWAPEAMNEVIGHIYNSYMMLENRSSLEKFLQETLDKTSNPLIISLLFELTSQSEGKVAGQSMLLNLVRKYPSLEGLYLLAKVKSNNGGCGQQVDDYSVLTGLLSGVIKPARSYYCRQCGFQSNTLHWQCPGCKQWGSTDRRTSLKLLITDDSSDFHL